MNLSGVLWALWSVACVIGAGVVLWALERDRRGTRKGAPSAVLEAYSICVMVGGEVGTEMSLADLIALHDLNSEQYEDYPIFLLPYADPPVGIWITQRKAV